MHKVIAIDGYSASGKGTVADLLAKKLGYLRVDSGKFYRSIAYIGLKENIDFESDNAIIKLANSIDFEYRNNEMFANGENVSDKLKTKEIDTLVIRVCEIYEVRHIVNKKIRGIRKFYDIIIDGRDTTSAVFPDADVKVYLTASFETRVKRRYDEYIKAGKSITIDEVRENIKFRDHSDDTREEGKLIIVPDALVIDSTNLTALEVVDMIINRKECEK